MLTNRLNTRKVVGHDGDVAKVEQNNMGDCDIIPLMHHEPLIVFIKSQAEFLALDRSFLIQYNSMQYYLNS